MRTKMTKNKIAEYARMASLEAHEEWMALSRHEQKYYMQDVISEMIDKFDYIDRMARRKWYQNLFK
jgi:hypothetical protein